MASTSEVGHAKNVANFQDLIEFISAYGANYNPSKNTLKLPQIIAQKAEAENNLAEVITKNTDYNNKVNLRVDAFSDVRALATRLIAALQTTDASKETIADAKTFNNKIQGKGSSTQKPPLNPNDPPPKTISTSQQSYDQIIQHLAGLKAVLEAEVSYTPNETDLQIATIDGKIEDLTQKYSSCANLHRGKQCKNPQKQKPLHQRKLNLRNRQRNKTLHQSAIRLHKSRIRTGKRN